MNFALSIIALTFVVALICFYPLLRSIKAKEDKKRDELNKALYFSRLKEIEQDNQQGLVENVEQLKQELQKTLLEDIPQQETKTIDKVVVCFWFIRFGHYCRRGLFPFGILESRRYDGKNIGKITLFL